MYKHLTLLIAAGTLFTGCANTPYQSRPHMSEALNIMQAAGYRKIRDVDADLYGERGQVRRTDSTLAGGAAYGITSGLSSGLGAGALGFAGWMMTGNQNPASRTRLIAWLPSDQASDSDAAVQLIQDVAYEALQTAAKEVELEPPYSIEPARYQGRPWDQSTITWNHLIIRGGECDREEHHCGYSFGATTAPSRRLVEITAAPAFLGGYSAYAVKPDNFAFSMPYSSTRQSQSWTEPHRWYATFDDLRFLTVASRHMPEWMMIYIAPRTVGTKDADGNRIFLPYPMILRQGEELYFIRPGSQRKQ
jgi:hypothetical protein